MNFLPPLPDASGWGWLAATMLLYLAFARLHKHLYGHVLAHPLLLSVAAIITILELSDLPAADYAAGGDWLLLWLAPAIVALAVPVYDNLAQVRAQLPAFAAAVLAGVSTAIFTALAVGWLFDVPHAGMLALTTKSITSGIALAVAGDIGAPPALAAGLVIATGIIGVVLGVPLFRFLGLADTPAAGVAFGVAAGGIGTAEALRRDARAGAFAALGMGITGALVGVVLPLFFL